MLSRKNLGKVLAQVVLVGLLGLALCSTAGAQVKFTALPGNNQVYRGNAVSQTYYISLPAGTTHVGLIFDILNGSVNSNIIVGNGPADPSALLPGVLPVPFYCVGGVQSGGSAPVSFFPLVAGTAGSTVLLDCPAPITGKLEVMTVINSGTTQWTFSVNAFTSPASALNSMFGDPCLSPAIPKNQISIAVAAAGTVQIVGGLTGKIIYPCGFSVTSAQTATANTFLFEYGTGATCTSPTTITGTYGAGGVTVGIPLVISYPLPMSPSGTSGNSLCIVVTGTTPNVQGLLTYLQF